MLETTKLRNFLSRKVRKCLEMSAKNIRPTFGTKRPRVRIPTLRPNPAEIFRFHPDFSAYSELFSMENSVTFPSDPNRDPKAERSGKHRRGADGIIRPSPAVFCGLHGLADDAADGVGGVTLHPLRGVGVGAEGKARVVVAQRTGQRLDVHAVLEGQRGEGVPLRYNNDKRKKP